MYRIKSKWSDTYNQEVFVIQKRIWYIWWWSLDEGDLWNLSSPSLYSSLELATLKLAEIINREDIKKNFKSKIYY